jgi:hypothetical protein
MVVSMLRRSFVMAVLIFMAPSCWAIEFGWEALPDGGIEYVVQVEPELISTFQEQGYTSAIPKGLRDIRRIRIQVGSGRLPNHGDLSGPQPVASAVARDTPQEKSSNLDEARLASKSAEPSVSDKPKSRQDSTQSNAGAGSNAEKSQWLNGSAGDRPPLPFFQSGRLKQMPADNGVRDESALSISQAPTVGEKPDKPQLRGNEGRVTPVANMEPGNQLVRADKPAASGAADADSASKLPDVGDTRPWLLLMLILITLFASIAGNVYLAWIYQTARGQYRLLARQLSQPRSAAG